uniref:Uncharacterized protein n=1 Tax=Aegilops tauschii subsp. strangulata TaxID=200361 RepID=A0A453NTM0_AEGTS
KTLAASPARPEPAPTPPRSPPRSLHPLPWRRPSSPHSPWPRLLLPRVVGLLPPPPPSLLRHHTGLPASAGVQLTAASAGGRWRPQLMHKLASPWRRSRAAPAPRHPLLPSSAGGLRGHHLGRCCLFHPAGGARGEQQQRGQATSGRVCGGAHIRVSFPNLSPLFKICVA